MTYSQQVQQQTQSYNKNLGSYFNGITANYETELENASRGGENLQLLGKSSTLLAGKLQERKEYLTKQAKLKYYNAALEGIEQGKFDILDEANTPEDRSEQIDLVVDEIRNGMPLEWGERFLGLGDVQNRFVQQAYINAKTAGSLNDIKKIISDDGLDVSTNSNVAGSIAAARTKWMQSNFMGFDEDLVINNTPKLLEQSRKLSKSYEKQNNLSRSIELENQSLVELQYGEQGWGDFYKQLALTYNPKTGAPRTPGEINAFANAALENIASQGGFTGKLREKYINHVPEWGGGKTLGELKDGFVSSLDIANADAQKKIVESYITRKNTAAEESANELYEEYRDLVRTGNTPNDDWVALKLRDHKRIHGERGIERFNEMFTTNEITEEEAVRSLDLKYARDRFISKDDPLLDYLGIDAYNKFASVLQEPSVVKEFTDNEEKAKGLIRGEVNVKEKFLGVLPGTFSTLGKYVQQEALEFYLAKRLRYFNEGADAEAAHDKAIAETLKSFEPNKQFDLDNPGKLKERLLNPTKETDNEDRRFTATVLDWIGRNPKRNPTQNELKVDKDLLDSIQDFYDGKIPNPPAEVRNIADRIGGKTVYDVMDVLSAAGGRPIKVSPISQAESVIRETDPAVSRKLRYPNPAYTTQAGIDLESNALSYRSPDVSHPAVRNQLNIFSDPHMRAIGLNEGTVNNVGTPTEAYYGHIDVGDGNNNKGIFSGREGLTTEQANAFYYKQANDYADKYRSVVESHGVRLGTQAYDIFMFNIKDLAIQAPAAVSAFVIQIPEIIRKGISADSVGYARTEAFVVYRNGEKKYDTSFKTYEDLRRDQTARSMTIVTGKRG
tara:strand:+ start:735 stop:3254 length:2520 start_codon:yes stop_codon:yes gene_type:complete